MSETRKLAAILVADVVGYSRLAGADEDRTLARLRGLRSDLIDPAIAAHHGRIVKRTGDGSIIEFRSVVDAVRCAIEVQNGLIERNAGVPPDRRIEFRVGVHLGDVVEEADGDLMGDGVNIAARLEGVCEPGAICLSEDAYRQVKGRLDLAVTDLGQTQLKNIAEPIRVYSLEVGKPALPKPAMEAKSLERPPEPKRRLARAQVALVIAALLVLIAAGAWYLLAGNRGALIASNAPAQAAHLSIVVLPFKNLSGDPAQDYLVDGITDNLTTDLSRIRNSFVIASTTAFTYKSKTVDAKEIGKELGVRYVLEGSAQRDGNRMRVNAQLIDAETGAHLWAERFEEDVGDLFKLQDQVVARLDNTLGLQLVKAEAARGTHSNNPDVVDLTMRGNAVFQLQPLTKDNNDAARTLFEQALKIDPNDVVALTGDAVAHLHEKQLGWTRPETDYEAKILGQAERAIVLAPNSELPYYAKGYYLFLSRRENEAVGAADAGLAINPNSALLYGVRALAQNSLGHFEQAKSDVTNAMRLSPHDPFMLFWPVSLGDAELGLGHLDAAIDAYHRSIDLGFRTFIPYVDLAAAYALQGKMEDAKTALAEARRLYPGLTVKWLQSIAPNIPNLFDGARKAGLPEEASVEPAHLSIVVLPFTNLSSDPGQDYFADGITESLTTDLSRLSGSFVIARNTAFTFKGKNVDAKEIGKELGVRYVLEGSVQRDPGRMRVNVQLIDAETGTHLWAERFDKPLTDLFDMQDEIVARLANQLGTALIAAEARRAERASKPDSLDLYFQGMAWFNKGLSPEYLTQARGFFERALALDPGNIDALVGTARVDAVMAAAYMTDDRAARFAAAEATLTKVLSVAPNDAWAHFWMGVVKDQTNRTAEGIAEVQRALALDPNLAAAHGEMGNAKIFTGQAEETEAQENEALRLSPRDNFAFVWMLLAGAAKVHLGANEEAVEWLRRSIEANRNLPMAHFFLAAALGNLGKLEEARAETQAGLALNPNFSVHGFRVGAESNNPIFLTQRERLLEGLRKAGVPEQ